MNREAFVLEPLTEEQRKEYIATLFCDRGWVDIKQLFSGNLSGIPPEGFYEHCYRRRLDMFETAESLLKLFQYISQAYELEGCDLYLSVEDDDWLLRKTNGTTFSICKFKMDQFRDVLLTLYMELRGNITVNKVITA